MKRSPLKRKTPLRKRSAKTLTAELDKLFSKYIRQHGKCEAAGYEYNGRVIACSDRLECAHLKSRRHKAIRWDPINARCLCNSHHRFFTEHPDEWTRWNEARAPGIWDWLNRALLEGYGGEKEALEWLEHYKRCVK